MWKWLVFCFSIFLTLSSTKLPAIHILELGCGNLSYIQAYLEQRIAKNLPISSVLVTDIVTMEYAHSVPNIESGIAKLLCLKELHGLDLEIRFEIDATKLGSMALPQQRYQAIHFNMPHNRMPFQSGEMQKLMFEFFSSAGLFQEPGDKIYVAAPQQYPDKYYFQAYYNLYAAPLAAKYQIHKKRKFTGMAAGILIKRYPNYTHIMTGDACAEVANAKNAREFVYVKTNREPDLLRVERRPFKKTVYDVECECLGGIQTDNESDDDDFASVLARPQIPSLVGDLSAEAELRDLGK
jgi:hypothetical protein